MKTLVACILTAGVALASLSPAQAAEGCGPGGHRGPRGYCRPNGPPPRLAVGNYYHGQGYWDGHRYWQHRYRYRDGWRYR